MGFLKDVGDALGFFTAPVGELFRPEPEPSTKVQCDKCFEKYYKESYDYCPYCALRKQVMEG